jgi:3-oxoacyl-[acyl-carrier-protein] synthase II
VVITGMGGISPLGCEWHEIEARLRERRNAVCSIEEWSDIRGLNTRLGVPAAEFSLPPAR